MQKLRKKLVTTAVGVALALGVAAHTLAAPATFTIDPAAIPGNTFALVPFASSSINGDSSELLILSGDNATGSGYLKFTGYQGVGALTHGLTIDYNLYLLFSLSAALSATSPQPAGVAGSVYDLTALSFSAYADPTPIGGVGGNTFTPATTAGGGTPASVSNTGDDIFLGSGSLIQGTAGFNNQGGVFLNSTNTFSVCTGPGTATLGPNVDCLSSTGSDYFDDPKPFYNLAFAAFNNTSQGISRNGNVVAITSAAGVVDFNATSVPEPGSLALMGLALASLGFVSRRKKKLP